MRQTFIKNILGNIHSMNLFFCFSLSVPVCHEEIKNSLGFFGSCLKSSVHIIISFCDSSSCVQRKSPIKLFKVQLGFPKIRDAIYCISLFLNCTQLLTIYVIAQLNHWKYTVFTFLCQVKSALLHKYIFMCLLSHSKWLFVCIVKCYKYIPYQPLRE